LATPLEAVGGALVDTGGGTIILRGVSIAHKTPPFTVVSAAELGALPALGVNAIRLAFDWEAYQPEKGHPGVAGYELLNEPFGDEAREIYPLYQDAANVILGIDADALIFLDPYFGRGDQATALPRPSFRNAVFAPH
jgi:hypothetical protein